MAIPNKPEEIKAYIDSQVSQTLAALRAEQLEGHRQIKEVVDAFGGKMNVTDGELGGLKVQLGNISQRVDALEQRATWGVPTGTNMRRENVTAKRETKVLDKFGDRNGPSYIDWCFDVYTAMEQCCEEVNLITSWVDTLEKPEQITEQAFQQWVSASGQNPLDMQWALKQLFYLLTAKLTGALKDIAQAEMGKGIVRGATTWKRVQIHAAGMTQNRRLELLDKVSHPRKAKTFDELAELLPAWERNVRELEKFPQSSLSDDQKIGFLRQLATDELEKFLNHMSASGTHTYNEMRIYVESQVAQKRSAQSYIQGRSGETKTDKGRSGAMDLGNIGDASVPQDADQRHCEVDSGKNYENYSTCTDYNQLYAVGGKGKGGWPINGNCDHCGQFGHAWRHCPRLDEAGKAAMAQRKGQSYKGGPKGSPGSKGAPGGKGPLWSGGGYGKGGKGYQGRPWGHWGQTSYGKGFGKQKGLNEVSEWGPDAWDLTGIHALTNSFVMPKKPLAIQAPQAEQKLTIVRNSFEALAVEDEDYPEMQETIGVNTSRQKQIAAPRVKFSGRRKVSLHKMNGLNLDPMRQTEKKQPISSQSEDYLNSIGMGKQDVVEATIEDRSELTVGAASGNHRPGETRLDSHRLAFLGPLEPVEQGLHHVQASPGYQWKVVASIMDSGAINSVAPASVSTVPLAESKGSLNGMQYHTADGTRIPNLGQKTLAAISDEGTPISQTFQIAEISRPLTSVGELADAGNVVVFGRKGGYVYNVDSGRRLDFSREHGVYLLRTWIQEPSQDENNPSFARQG